jgi:hypothetical protein
MQKSRVPDISDDISATRLSAGDPWAFRPTLADGLVLSSIYWQTGCYNFLIAHCRHQVKAILAQQLGESSAVRPDRRFNGRARP